MFQSKKAEIETIKKTWTQTSSTFRRYRQTPLHHIRVKAHAMWREHWLLLLVLLLIGDFPKQE